MNILAELMNGTRGLVYEGENEGANAGASTQPAAAGNDTQPAAAGNETQAAGTGEDTQPAGAAATAQPDRKDRRIGQLTARNAELARKLAEAQAAKPAPAAPAKPLDATADFEARVAAKVAEQADQLVALRTFNDRCNAAVDQGRKDFGKPEFDASIADLQTLVDPTDPGSLSNYQDFLESVLETGAGPALLFELGKDLDEAERIFALPSKRRVIELARKADVVAKPAEPSATPKPLKAIESHGGRHEAIKASDAEKSDNLSTAEWMARRNAEVAAQPRR